VPPMQHRPSCYQQLWVGPVTLHLVDSGAGGLFVVPLWPLLESVLPFEPFTVVHVVVPLEKVHSEELVARAAVAGSMTDVISAAAATREMAKRRMG
jgi:hypothetical protein